MSLSPNPPKKTSDYVAPQDLGDKGDRKKKAGPPFAGGSDGASKDGYDNPAGGDKGDRKDAKNIGKSQSKDGYDDSGINGDFGFSGAGKKSKGFNK